MNAASSGLSGTPLENKLRLKVAQNVAFAGMLLPPDWLASVAEFASVQKFKYWDDVAGETRPSEEFDVVHGFSISRADLEGGLIQARKVRRGSSMIGVSWPKRAFNVVTDITEDTIREICLPIGLVDVKVCAGDEIWSGLKLILWRERRHKG